MCDHHLDRRALLITGAGVATTAALVDFEPAAAGDVVTKTFRGKFSDPDTADWHYVPFRVPRGVRQIEVDYDFHPTDTGLGFTYNVVDIGIFDPSGHGLGNAAGFRGWSGGARRHFRISRTSATPGYLAGPITPGVWNILLGPVHDRAAGYAVPGHRHAPVRPAGAEVRADAGAAERAGDGTGVVPRRPARPHRSTPTASGPSGRCCRRPARPGSTSSTPPTTTPARPPSTGAGTSPTTSW